MTEPVYIDRPPRIQPELPFDLIEVPSPPDKDDGTNNRLVQVALPLVTIIGYILVSTLGGSGRSPAMLLPMALSVVASVGYSNEEIAEMIAAGVATGPQEGEP